MRITRQRFFERIGERLSGAGLVPVPGGTESNPYLWYRFDGDLVLTVGLEFSSHFRGDVSASLYLNQSFLWSFIPAADFPWKAYQRIGAFLRARERARLVEESQTEQGVVDAWWDSSRTDALEAMSEALELAIPRFVNQRGLKERLRSSDAFRTHVRRLKRISEVAVRRRRIDAAGPTSPSSLPPGWVSAAEQVLQEERAEYVARLTRMLGLDAWRFWRLEQGRSI